MGVNFKLNESFARRHELDLKKSHENLELVDILVTDSDKLNLTLVNTGHVASRITYIGEIIEAPTSQKHEYNSTDITIDIGEIERNIAGDKIDYAVGEIKKVVVVTELGNVFFYSYPPPSTDDISMGNSLITITGINTLEYNPTSYNLFSAIHGSGSVSDLEDNDGAYLTFISSQNSSLIEKIYYVDNDDSDVDGSTNKGNHSNFSAQQAGPDSVTDTLTETQVIEDVGLDFIDNNSSDVDTSVSIGNHSNFENEKAVDSAYNVLTEENVPVTEWLNCNSYSNTWSAWYRTGTSPYLNAQDQPTNMVYEKSGGQTIGWFGFSDTGLVGSLNLDISIYCRNNDGVNDDNVHVYVDYTGSGAGTLVGEVGAHTTWQYDTINLGAHSVSEVNNLRVYFVVHNLLAADDVYVDHVRLVVRGVNQRLDIENQFTSVSTSYDVTELCIKTGTTGTEDLSLSIWNSSSGSWNILVTDLPGSGWTNHTITDYVTSAITIRFLDGTKTLDITQDSWSIDAVLLRQHNLTYQLDLEVQWTDIDYTHTNEMLSIYITSDSSEALMVDAWDGDSWENVIPDLSLGWNNVSVSSYLVSSNFTIRFKGSVESIDSSQNSWGVDATLLYLSDQAIVEVELIGTSNLSEWTDLVWQIDSSWNVSSVPVTIQLYDFSTSSYPESGDGYYNYVSDSSPGTDEWINQTITTDPTQFRNSTGHWKIKIRGGKSGVTKLQLNLDSVGLVTNFEFSGTPIDDDVWYNYRISARTHENDPVSYGYTSIYHNGTSVSIRSVETKQSLSNPDWVYLNENGEYFFELKSSNPLGEILKLSTTVGDVVGTKIIIQNP